MRIQDGSEIVAHSDWIKCKLDVGNDQLTLYPNPVTSTLFINPDPNDYGTFELELFNQSLQLIEGRTLNYNKGDLLSLNCSGLQNGIYFIWMKSGGEIKTRKFVKH